MINLLIILIGVCSFLIFYSYILYPIVLKLLVKNKIFNHLQYQNTDHLPRISIIFSALNEENIIEKKIHSLFNTSYPLDKLHVFVGSDQSIDNTNEILKKLTIQYPSLHCYFFDTRRGKANVLNEIKKKYSFLYGSNYTY